MWNSDRDFVPPHREGLHFNIVYYPFHYLSIPVGLGSSASILSSLDSFAGSFPFEAFLTMNYCLTLVYNLINCHLSNDRTRFFPYRFRIVHFSPTLSVSQNEEFALSFWFLKNHVDIHTWFTVLDTLLATVYFAVLSRRCMM